VYSDAEVLENSNIKAYVSLRKKIQDRRGDSQLSKKLGMRMIDNNGETTFSGDEVT